MFGISLPSLPKPPIPIPIPTPSNPIPKPPKPSEVLVVPPPPKILGGGAQKLYDIGMAPIRSTIAADPLLSWAETGKWSSHAARTRAGVHELYKQDRLAQRLGVREKDVVTVVEVAQVVVAIYFGASFFGAGSGAGGAAGTSASAGTVGTATGTGLTLAEVNQGIALVGTIAKAANRGGAPGGSSQDMPMGAEEFGAQSQSGGGAGGLVPIALGSLGLLAALVL